VSKVNGIFVDRLDLPPEKEPKANTLYVQSDPPRIEAASLDPTSAQGYAFTLWNSIDQHWTSAGMEGVAMRYGVEAYRAAALAHEADSGPVLKYGRWKLHLWDEEDRNAFDATMQAGFKEFNRVNGRGTP
jgi:hypothetical protein